MTRRAITNATAVNATARRIGRQAPITVALLVIAPVALLGVLFCLALLGVALLADWALSRPGAR